LISSTCDSKQFIQKFSEQEQDKIRFILLFIFNESGVIENGVTSMFRGTAGLIRPGFGTTCHISLLGNIITIAVVSINNKPMVTQ